MINLLGILIYPGVFHDSMEVLHIVWRAEGEEPARHGLRLVDSLTVEWTACDNDILESAARLQARGNLSMADSWIAATAIVTAQLCRTKIRSSNHSRKSSRKS